MNRGKHGQLDFENIDDLEDGTPIVARYNNREFQFGIYGEGYVIYQDCWQTKAGVLVFSLEQSSIEGFFEDSTVYEYTPDFEFDKKTKAVSRRHAVIERQADGSYALVDLSSSAGTFVDGQRLTANVPQVLHRGARVAFGTAGADYVWEE